MEAPPADIPAFALSRQRASHHSSDEIGHEVHLHQLD
jgi:hypothetical protein